MAKLLGVLTVLSLTLVAGAAAADPTPVTLKNTVIRGRPARPSVVIEVTRPTAARAAGVAHAEMRDAWLARSAPVALRSAQ